MISHKFKCIYIHQRKTAGLSIISSFDLNRKDPDWHLLNDGHLSPEYDALNDTLSWYYKFTTVRNPFDRFVSGWKFLAATRDRPLEDVLHDPPREGRDFRHLTRQQTAIVVNGEGRLIVDFVIRYEDLQAGYDHVCDIIEKPRMILPVVNTTTRNRDYRTYFNAKTRALAEELFRDDLTTFGYEF
jgi:hypothetical protein